MEDLLHIDVDKLKGLLDVISDNYAAFILICGWMLYDVNDRADLLPALLEEFVIVELVTILFPLKIVF
jgi:hypothetical protein